MDQSSVREVSSPVLLTDHIVAAQELAGQRAGALVSHEGNRAVHDYIADSGRILDQPFLAAWEVRLEPRLVIQKPQHWGYYELVI